MRDQTQTESNGEDTTYNVSLGTKKNEEFQLQQIASERVTQQIQDDITSLRNKLNQTPLSFYAQITGTYLFSFNKQKVLSHILKTIVLGIFEFSVGIFISYVLTISDEIKHFMFGLIMFNLTLFILLFFIDPGTLFEDEKETIDDERYFCQPCRLYRYQSTHHCRYCIKCVKGYDHHCSFFGKCIGRRNYLMFCLFILSMGTGGMLSIVSLVYTVFKGM